MMRRVVIFGNSGAGKSTLAKRLVASAGGVEKLVHLDLDTLAWLPTIPPERKPMAASQQEIDGFIKGAHNWVIEGCYSDLLEFVLPLATELIFLNLPIEDCVANAEKRPWEPHKYVSKAAQDKNLMLLVDWIRQYSMRTDTFSQLAHTALYEQYDGTKTMLTSNQA